MEENTYHYASYIFVQLQQLRSCVTQFMFWLLNQSISRENFECSFRYSKVVLEDLSTQPANIWDQSAQNKQLHLRVKFLRMKQFEQSKSSYSSNTTNTDHSFWERNGTSFRTRRDPLAPTEIFELQPGNFGWMDRTPNVSMAMGVFHSTKRSGNSGWEVEITGKFRSIPSFLPRPSFFKPGNWIQHCRSSSF